MNNFKNLYEQLDRMSDLINYKSGDYNEDNPAILYEGLIRSVSQNKAKVLLQRLFPIFKLKDKILIDKKDNSIFVDIIDYASNKNNVDKILSYINNLGYFISIVYIKRKGENELKDTKYSKSFLISKLKEHKNLINLIVVLEAKFDIEIDEKDWPDKLYHVTRQDVLFKIKKIGIAPRTESKKSTHPERIYFAKKYEDAYDIVYNFKKDNPEQKFVILEINPKKVNHLRLFDDPNYKGYGYYILVNVHPNAIKIIKENL